MQTYEFSFVVDGLSPLDPDHSDRLSAAGADDAMVFSDGDRTLVAFYRDAATATEAITTAAKALERAYPDAAICRVDRDLVSATDIADRIGVSRETVRKWVTGERGSGDGFPMPLGNVSNGTRIWEWTPVYYWLAARGYEVDDSAQPLPLEVVTRFEANLIDRRVPALPDITVVDQQVRTRGRKPHIMGFTEAPSDHLVWHGGMADSKVSFTLRIKGRTVDAG